MFNYNNNYDAILSSFVKYNASLLGTQTYLWMYNLYLLHKLQHSTITARRDVFVTRLSEVSGIIGIPIIIIYAHAQTNGTRQLGPSLGLY